MRTEIVVTNLKGKKETLIPDKSLVASWGITEGFLTVLERKATIMRKQTYIPLHQIKRVEVFTSG